MSLYLDCDLVDHYARSLLSVASTDAYYYMYIVVEVEEIAMKSPFEPQYMFRIYHLN